MTIDFELNNFQFSDICYTVLMARFCDKIKLPYKMMACMHKYDGRFEDIVSPYEVSWGIYVPNPKGDALFIEDFGEQSNIYELAGSLSGTDVIIFDPRKPEPYQVIKYPEGDYRKNTITHRSEVVLSDDKKFEYRFINDYTYKGQQKSSINDVISNQFRNVNLYTNARFSGMVNYMDIYSEEIAPPFKSMEELQNFINELGRIDSFWKLYIKGYHKGGMSKFLYDEYDFREIEIDSFKLSQDGEIEDNDTSSFHFRIEFKANGVIDKTSNDTQLVMNLGRLITEQYQLSNYKVNERFGHVYNSTLRMLTWDINVELPKGYKCVNLADFNQQFENEAGIFRTEIVESEGKLLLKVTKIYKASFLPKEKWLEMVTYLQQAASYYNKKLLLEKK
jgi:hypothetical protein